MKRDEHVCTALGCSALGTDKCTYDKARDTCHMDRIVSKEAARHVDERYELRMARYKGLVSNGVLTALLIAVMVMGTIIIKYNMLDNVRNVNNNIVNGFADRKAQLDKLLSNNKAILDKLDKLSAVRHSEK